MTPAEREALAERFQQGDEAALAYFYHSHFAPLVVFAQRWIKDQGQAEDIVAEAFVKTWRQRAHISSYAGLRAYLYKIVVRDSRLSRQKNERRTEVQNLSQQSSSEVEESPFELVVRSELYQHLYDALLELPEGSRKVLSLYFFEGKSSGEIARELSLSTSTIKTQKLRGLTALRKKFPGRLQHFLRALTIIFPFL